MLADTDELPSLNGELISQTALSRCTSFSPDSYVGAGSLRPAPHTTGHCGAVLLTRCGLGVEYDYGSSFHRLITPGLGFIVADSIDTLIMDDKDPVGEGLE